MNRTIDEALAGLGRAEAPARLLSTREAAVRLGLSARTLEKWRSRQNPGPSYRRVGRLVKYAEEDLAEFIATARSDAAPRHRGTQYDR